MADLVTGIDCVWEAGAILGEGPLYDPRCEAILWVDIKGAKLFHYDIQSGKKRTTELDVGVSAMGLHKDGGYICTRRDGFHHISLGENGSPRFSLIADPESHLPGNRFNDGKTDPFGGFWAGTMDDAEEDDRAGTWWRLSADLTVQKLASRFHVTNGPTFDAGRSLVYFTDSARQTIYRAALTANGRISGKSVFKTFGPDDGYPDGMSIDKDGHIWVAFWDGACLRRLDPAGEVMAVIPMLVPRPTSIAFAGNAAYVTSASIGLSEVQKASAPLSGGLFKLSLSRDLMPETFFFG